MTTSDYVKIECPKYKRSVMAILWVCILLLEIITSRYYRIPTENRLYKLCKKIVVDEIHFCCTCDSLKDVKIKYSYLFNTDEQCPIEQFINLMSYTNNQRQVLNYNFDLWQKHTVGRGTRPWCRSWRPMQWGYCKQL